MTPSLIVVAFGAVAAVVGTGVLAARSARAPRLFLIALTIAIFGLTVALAAQTIGDLAGYSGTIFRAMELGGQALAPLALCLGAVELIGASLPARFAMRLAASAMAVVVFVILGSDPLNPGVGFSRAWPSPALHYETIPKGLIDFLAAFTMVTALAAALVLGIRSSRGRGRAEVTQPGLVVAAAAAVVALPGLSSAARLPVPPKDLFALTCALAAGLVWFAARAADHRGLIDEPLHEAGDGQAGYRGRGMDRGQRAGAGRPDGRGDADRRDTGDQEADVRYPGLAALMAEPDDLPGRPAAADYGTDGSAGRYDDSGSWDDPAWFAGADSQVGPRGEAAGLQDDRPGYYGRDHRGRYDEPDGPAGHGAYRAGQVTDPRGSLFGQIAIYTLLDDRVNDFDRLTERVVEQVRAGEPGTLVYIVHAVPTAPLQRILYEVYQDRAAYDEHLRRPYVAKYEADRRRFVLATNVIELGLQQAKVSPFPSFSAISDILTESGIDLTGVTKSSRGGQRGREPGLSRPGGDPAGGYQPADWREPPPRHGSPRGRADEPGYEGWAGLRREDPGYR